MRSALFVSFFILLSYTAWGQSVRGNTNQPVSQEIRETEMLLAEAQKFYLIEDFAKALNGFQEVLQRDSENPAANFKVAQILEQSEKYDEALVYALAAKEADPNNRYYVTLLAELHSRLANYAAAAKVYEEMIEQIPGTEEYLYKLAALYLFQRRVNRALYAYSRLEDAYGKSPEISYQKQKILISQNKVDEAIKEAESLIEAFPSETEHVYALVDLLINQGRKKKAVQQLEQLLAKEPGNGRAHLVLADLYRQEGNTAAGLSHLFPPIADASLALEEKLRLLAGYIMLLPKEGLEPSLLTAAKELVEVHPTEPKAWGIYGDLLFQTGDKEGARKQYLQGVALDANNFDVWQNIIAIDWEKQDYEQVIAHTTEALELFPNQALLYYYQGHANYLQKEYEEATLALEQGKRLAFRNAELQGVFFGLLGDAYNAMKQYRQSDKAYEDAIKLNPNNTFVLNNYSYFLSLRKENLNRARELSEKLVSLEPENATYLDTHAWVLYQLGDYTGAVDLLKRAVNQGNASGTILEHYGDTLHRLSRISEAVAAWEQAKEAGGHSELLEKKIADRQLYENP